MQRLTDAEGVGLGPEAVARAGVGAPTAFRMVLTIVGACTYCRCPDQPVTCRVHGAAHAAGFAGCMKAVPTIYTGYCVIRDINTEEHHRMLIPTPHALELTPTLVHYSATVKLAC